MSSSSAEEGPACIKGWHGNSWPTTLVKWPAQSKLHGQILMEPWRYLEKNTGKCPDLTFITSASGEVISSLLFSVQIQNISYLLKTCLYFINIHTHIQPEQTRNCKIRKFKLSVKFVIRLLHILQDTFFWLNCPVLLCTTATYMSFNQSINTLMSH